MAMDADWLSGKEVVFTGRLASMKRSDAMDLVRRHGGRCARSLTTDTSLLVVGQDGWLGHAQYSVLSTQYSVLSTQVLTRTVRHAQQLIRAGQALEILHEEALLDRLQPGAAADGVRGAHTVAQLSRLLRTPGSRIRGWVRARLIAPTRSRDGLDYFSYRQVSAARSLLRLLQKGATVTRVRRSLEQLRGWFGDADESLAVLVPLGQNGRLGVRLDSGGLVDPRRQIHFDYCGEPACSAIALPQVAELADGWFDRACLHEDAGELAEAEHCYRTALLAGGPDATIAFNLANVLYRLGRKQESAERFWSAVELDAEFAEAWNNLGVVIEELGRPAEAVRAFRRAIELRPDYADARQNLADTLNRIA
jgi:tetratricopeptide (TPR) repeat protein